MRCLLALMLLLASLSAQAFDHTHSAWTALLKKHVSWTEDGHASWVDYAGFRQQRAALDAYLADLSGVSADDYQYWQPNEQLAFLINAYNAFTIKLILDHQPIDSIRDIGYFFYGPWSQRFFELLGETRTLDQLEHTMIRAPGVFDEPRIHFAVNCASVGCPALRTEAFTADTLAQQLDDSQQRFLSDPGRNRIDCERRRASLSPIFDWYEEDFERAAGSLAHYIAGQACPPVPAHTARTAPAAERPWRITFNRYNWQLNTRANTVPSS